MQEEKKSQRTLKQNWKYIVLLFIGIFLTIIAVDFGGLSKHNIPSFIGYMLCYLLLCFFGFGLLALIISKKMGNVRRYCLPILACLFLIVGLFSSVTEVSKKLSSKYKKFAFNLKMIKQREMREQMKSQKGILTHIGGPMISGPKPADGATLKDTSLKLSWPKTNYAVSYDVYFGDNFDDVNAGAQSTFVDSQTYTSTFVGLSGRPFPDGLVPGTTYFWRIDEVNRAEPDSPYKGYVYRFSISRRYDYLPYRDETESKDESKKADKNSP